MIKCFWSIAVAARITGDSVKILGSLYNTTCKMAVDRNHQGKGLGAALLHNALLLVISSSQLVVFRANVVDGVGEKAKRFYEHSGFFPIKRIDMKLILSTADILKSSLEACDGRDC